VLILVARPAYSQIAVVDVDNAIVNTKAYKDAQAKIKIKFAVNIAQFEKKNRVIAELLKTKNLSPTQKAGSDFIKKYDLELREIAEPFVRPDVFARSQIREKLGAALSSVMVKNAVKIALRPSSVLGFATDANLTKAVTEELHQLVPKVSINPPADWSITSVPVTET
jgi:Skp family chaperone for outer membrane proteins